MVVLTSVAFNKGMQRTRN
jgi:hypothetical protein